MDITTVWRFDMKAVRQMIATVLQLPENLVIDANEEVDVSTTPYFVTVLLSSQTEIGQEITYNAAKEEEYLRSLSEFTLSINAFGVNAFDAINKLVLSLGLTRVYELSRECKIGFLRASSIRNLPAAISGGKEQRAQVDLTFSFNNLIKMTVRKGIEVETKQEIN